VECGRGKVLRSKLFEISLCVGFSRFSDRANRPEAGDHRKMIGVITHVK
jgi:hypothetical protein